MISHLFRQQWLRIVFVCCLSITLLVYPLAGIPEVSGASKDLNARQQELEKINQEIEQKEKLVESAKREQLTISNQISVLETDIDKTETEIQYLGKKVQVLGLQIDQTKSELQEAEASLKTYSSILGQRLKAMYQNGEISYLEVLLDSSSFGDFLTRFDYLQKITDQDAALIKQVQEEQRKISTKKVQLETSQLQVKSAQDDSKNKQAYLIEQTQAKEKILSDIEKEKASYEKSLDELEADSNRIERLIQQMQSGSSGSSSVVSSGAMIWPVPKVRISSDYGMRIHPIYQTKRMHTGIDLPHPKGTKVKAAQAGKVIYAGWMNAYGQTVILDHGGNLSSLYGHLSSISVSNNATVKQGDIIGAVGSTGLSTGPHLHFEVRVNGAHVSPYKYL